MNMYDKKKLKKLSTYIKKVKIKFRLIILVFSLNYLQ